MDLWNWAVNSHQLLPFLALGLIATVLVRLFLRHRKSAAVETIAEYWIYSWGNQLPDQKALMDRIIGANPHTQRGQNPIGPAEGLVFSDVRWKISVVLKQKNPSLFDISLAPDILQQSVGFAEQLLDCQSIIKLQYVSTTRLKDKRHLQFLIHVADAVAESTGTKWVYDKAGERLWKAEELSEALSKQLDATQIELHAYFIENGDHSFESRGLRKIGVREFTTNPVPHDQKLLAHDLLTQYMKRCWEIGDVYTDSIEEFGDHFIFNRQLRKDGRDQIRILRRQEAR
jgi:hypothetical protein